MALSPNIELLYGDGFKSRRKAGFVIAALVDAHSRVFVLDALPLRPRLLGSAENGISHVGLVKFADLVDEKLKAKNPAASKSLVAEIFSADELAQSNLVCVVDNETKKSHFLLPTGEVLASKMLRGSEFISAINDKFVTLRFHTTFSFIVKSASDLEIKKKTISSAIKSGIFGTRIQEDKATSVLLLSDDASSAFKNLGDLRKKAATSKFVSYSIPEVLEISLYSSSSAAPSPPHVEVSKGDLKTVEVDLILPTPTSSSVASSLDSLRAAVVTQVEALVARLSSGDFDSARSLYFEFPFAIDRPFNVLLPSAAKSPAEDYNAPLRKEYHESFGLPLTSPIFLRSKAIKFTAATESENVRLKNVHYGLNTAGVGQVYLCNGVYDYYHYMQDGFSDNGWGCAYRSLQTIESWLINQGLSTKSVQNHTEIQKMIYLQGQREKGFVGSREWIGSIELQSVLREYMSISSKIIHVPSGNQIVDYVWDLIKHFETQGTPVMIGGGQLAYTLLGIDFNPESRRVMFLILDPHYTGKDELKAIQSKGWCGWKDTSLFKENAFYNLMLPQLPDAGTASY